MPNESEQQRARELAYLRNQARATDAVSRQASFASPDKEEAGRRQKLEEMGAGGSYRRLRQQAKNKRSFLKKIGGLETASALLANKLRNDIAQNNFSGYAVALGLAIIKDGWDLVTTFLDAGTSGAFINIFISLTLWFLLFQQSGIVERFIKKFQARIVAAIILEFTPILSFAPTYTILILMLKRSVDKVRHQMETQFKSLQNARSK